MTDFYDDDYDLETEDDDQQSDDSDYVDGDDSGNGETWWTEMNKVKVILLYERFFSIYYKKNKTLDLKERKFKKW